ncbi:MAG: NAD(P)/FAD-dependent oxidoreductase [Bacteroidota bacterium]|nr:NAD(P)/FAD-dependent oxidoreductase [Bacteroidota bacterium]
MQNKVADTYDIAIVGGGLAGLTLSIQAADAGYKVILFEKEAYPFHKVCGEYISLESWDFLQRCGLDLNHWSLPIIRSLRISDGRGRIYDFKLPLGGFGISRYKLDHSLSLLAKEKGVTLLTGTRVSNITYSSGLFELETGVGVFSSKVAVGSFGKRSNLDLKWNRAFVLTRPSKMNHYIGVKYHIRYPHPSDTIALHNFHNGYCGISQIEDTTCCLCYLTTADNLKQSNQSIPVMEREILSANPRLADIFSKAEFLYSQPLTISQVSFQQKTQVENHVLLLGDAAGMITPLCGNGMSMAMHAGKLAMESIPLFLKGVIDREEMELRYTRQWQEQFGLRTKIGRWVQYFFGNTTTTSIFLKSMHAIPALSRELIRHTHGQPF